jgi:small subunit ribosomal protein S21
LGPVSSLTPLLIGPRRQWVPAPSAAFQRGSESDLTEIRLKKGEPVEKALRRLKKKIDREGTLRTVRSHRHYEKPSEKRRRKMKVARFSAMLAARYADL